MNKEVAAAKLKQFHVKYQKHGKKFLLQKLENSVKIFFEEINAECKCKQVASSPIFEINFSCYPNFSGTGRSS